MNDLKIASLKPVELAKSELDPRSSTDSAISNEISISTLQVLKEQKLLTPLEIKELSQIESLSEAFQDQFERGLKKALSIDPNSPITPKSLEEQIQKMDQEKLSGLLKIFSEEENLSGVLEEYSNSPSQEARTEALQVISKKLAEKFNSSSFRSDMLKEVEFLFSNDKKLQGIFSEITTAFEKLEKAFKEFYRAFLQRKVAENAQRELLDSKKEEPQSKLKGDFLPHQLEQTEELPYESASDTTKIIDVIIANDIRTFHAREAEKIKTDIKILESHIRTIQDLKLKRQGRDNSLLEMSIGIIEKSIEVKRQDEKFHEEASAYALAV